MSYGIRKRVSVLRKHSALCTLHFGEHSIRTETKPASVSARCRPTNRIPWVAKSILSVYTELWQVVLHRAFLALFGKGDTGKSFRKRNYMFVYVYMHCSYTWYNSTALFMIGQLDCLGYAGLRDSIRGVLHTVSICRVLRKLAYVGERKRMMRGLVFGSSLWKCSLLSYLWYVSDNVKSNLKITYVIRDEAPIFK